MRRCRPLLGTFVAIDSDRPDAIDAAFAAIERVHTLMSAHDPESELSHINRFAHRAPVPVSDWTAVVIDRALHWSRVTNGRFDVVRAGRVAFERGDLPHHADQPQLATADWSVIQLTEGAVSLAQPACLDLGGIAKGFAVDRAVDALKAQGATRGLVNAGGDLRGFGSEAWTVEVVDPATHQPLVVIDVRDQALATSAGLVREDSSLAFDHLPNRDTRWTSVTVRAPLACDADALTKAVWSGATEADEWLENAGALAFALRKDGQVEAIGREAVAA